MNKTERVRAGYRPTRLVAILVGFVVMVIVNGAFASDWRYTVRPGDTIWKLCNDYVSDPLCWIKLPKLNNVANPRHLPPGSELTIPLEWLKEKPEPAIVVQVNGEAWIQQPGEEKKDIKVNDQIVIGTNILTGKGSVSIRLADESVLFQESQSLLIFDVMTVFKTSGMVDAKVRLMRGRARVRIKPFTSKGSRFEVTTPAAVAAVRGTKYRVSYFDDKFMGTEVIEGGVNLAAQSRAVNVNTGFGSITEEGRPPQEPSLLPFAPEFIGDGRQQAIGPHSVDWKDVSNAVAYQVDLYEGGIIKEDGTTKKIDEWRATESVATLPKLPAGQYLLSVSAISETGLQGLESQHRVSIAHKQLTKSCCSGPDGCKKGLLSLGLILLIALL